jgi:hypothetical protein
MSHGELQVYFDQPEEFFEVKQFISACDTQ